MAWSPAVAMRFPLTAVAWSIGLFALLRAPVVERYVVVPLTGMQEHAAAYYAGAPTAAIAVTAECSGTDVLALCVAAILAWPVGRRARLLGAVGGFAFVMALNTLRIASLGRAADSPELFRTLHLQVWPAILVLATAAYVFGWMWWVLGSGRASNGSGPVRSGLAADLVRFAPRAAVMLAAFALCGPWIEASASLQQAGAWVAAAAAFVLGALGVVATASGNVLGTTRGAFRVTGECLATALVPLYLAAVITVRMAWHWRVLALMAAPPLFAAFAVARVLLLALPPALAASPLFLVHGFHQMVLGVACVILAAAWHGGQGASGWRTTAARAAGAIAAAGALVVLGGSALVALVIAGARALLPLAPHTVTDLAPAGDVQGVLALLPAFQAALLLAAGLAAGAPWRRLPFALAALLASQVALLALLGEASAANGVLPHPLLLRAWSVAVPLALTLLMLQRVPRAPQRLAAPFVVGPCPREPVELRSTGS